MGNKLCLILLVTFAAVSELRGQFFSLQNGMPDQFGPNHTFFRGDDLFSPPVLGGGPILELPGGGFPNNAYPVNVDAFSFGLSGGPSPLNSHVTFSVSGGAIGASGSAVEQQAGSTQPVFRPLETPADIYHTHLGTRAGTNLLLYDGNGQGHGNGLLGSLGLFEGPNRPTPPAPFLSQPIVEGVDGLDMRPNLGTVIYYSVDMLSNFHPPYPVGSEADIFFENALPNYSMQQAPLSPGLYATGGQLQLQQFDNIDALEIYDRGTIGVFDGNDIVLFSLDPGSPSLFDSNSPYFNLSPGDVFMVSPGSAPTVFAFGALHLGLHPADDIDGLSLATLASIPEPAATLPLFVLLAIPLFASSRRRRLGSVFETGSQFNKLPRS